MPVKRDQPTRPRQQLRPVAVAILAGGASSRMGRNKALLRLREGSQTLIESVAGSLADAGFGSPLLVTNFPSEYTFLGLEMVGDEPVGVGPMGGLAAALNRFAPRSVLVVACDMPLLSPPLLRHMASLALSLPPESYALMPRWQDSAGKVRVEPLHAIYTASALPVVRTRIAASALTMSQLAGALNASFLDEQEARRYDPRLMSYRNINTPHEWEALIEEAGAGKGAGDL